MSANYTLQRELLLVSDRSLRARSSDPARWLGSDPAEGMVAGADAGAFRQAFLCQSGRQPIALEERAKWCSGRRWICGHTLSHPFLRRGNGAFVIVAPRMLDGEASVSERHGAAMHGGAE